MCRNIWLVFQHIRVSTAGEGLLTHKDPNEQRREAGEQEEPHNDPDNDAYLLFGGLLLFAGQEVYPLVAAILSLMRRKTHRSSLMTSCLTPLKTVCALK